MRTISIAALLLASCLSAPHDAPPDVGDIPCITCHASDFQKAMGTFPSDHTDTECQHCHDTTGWGGHPESKFPITTGAHSPSRCPTCTCDTCHRIPNQPYAGGANTDCLQCHSQSEYQSVDDHHDPYDTSMPHFCLTCHQNGQVGGGG